MRIILENIGKRYSDDWIFRNLNFEFAHADKCSITGPNGSGKSSLLNIISSRITPDEGKLFFESEGKTIPVEDAYKYISGCSPYIELIEEFTLAENIEFYSAFKKFTRQLTSHEVEEIIGLKQIQKKALHQFSSGMKQRVKLAFAVLSEIPVILLDEPCSNLDAEGISWYQEIISEYMPGKTIIVGSNRQNHEYSFCNRNISINDFRK